MKLNPSAYTVTSRTETELPPQTLQTDATSPVGVYFTHLVQARKHYAWSATGLSPVSKRDLYSEHYVRCYTN